MASVTEHQVRSDLVGQELGFRTSPDSLFRVQVLKAENIVEVTIQKRFSDKKEKTEILEVDLVLNFDQHRKGSVVLDYKLFEQGWRFMGIKNAIYDFPTTK